MSNSQSNVEESKEKTEKLSGATAPDAEKKDDKPIKNAIQGFVLDMRTIADAFPVTMKAVEGVAENSKTTLDDFLEKRKKKPEARTPEDTTKYSIDLSSYSDFKEILETFVHSHSALLYIPRSALTSLVSQFDAYIGHLLKAMFVSKPETINAANTNLNFKEILELGSMDDARDYIIEREIDSILRSSHKSQIEWIESKLKINFIKKYDKFPAFIEITERRNLFVHTDGRVSRQYLKICNSHSVAIEKDTKIGTMLYADENYIANATAILFEMGVLVGHLAWRKLRKEDADEADAQLIQITYDSVRREKYGVAIRILEFVLANFKQPVSESTLLTHVINLANACRLSGDTIRCTELMKKYDWRAKSYEYQLANAVLNENYKDAVHLMERIGAKGAVTKQQYKEWPLFIGFRETEDFLGTFEKIFGEPFAFSETSVTAKATASVEGKTSP